ncbi:MAG: hypothetical protein HUJ25_05720 [Crocinitomicaceae bacterium]|nr:hypothetical protein [Crocinitomicaceae bacterium]
MSTYIFTYRNKLPKGKTGSINQLNVEKFIFDEVKKEFPGIKKSDVKIDVLGHHHSTEADGGKTWMTLSVMARVKLRKGK